MNYAYILIGCLLSISSSRAEIWTIDFVSTVTDIDGVAPLDLAVNDVITGEISVDLSTFPGEDSWIFGGREMVLKHSYAGRGISGFTIQFDTGREVVRIDSVDAAALGASGVVSEISINNDAGRDSLAFALDVGEPNIVVFRLDDREAPYGFLSSEDFPTGIEDLSQVTWGQFIYVQDSSLGSFSGFRARVNSVSDVVVPEPGGIALLGLGIMAAWAFGIRRAGRGT